MSWILILDVFFINLGCVFVYCDLILLLGEYLFICGKEFVVKNF